MELMTRPLIDDRARPRLPAAASAPVTDAGRAGQQALVAVHHHLRQEMQQVLDVVGQLAAGAADPAATRSLVNRMTMRQNYWSVGAFCAAYCRVLTMHHAIEDQSMFADLHRRDTSLAPVLDRLSEEHEVIADLLDRLDRSLVALVGPTPSADDAARATAAVEELADTLLSHLTYEEEELVGPLMRLGILV
jgi:hypothetical protein